MRYTSWFRRSGATDAPSGAVNLGKKLLGYLSNQRRLGAPETQVIRRVMEDGTLVVASFIGGIPKVAIYPAGTELQPPACELYVESGLLDLGPNIAPDANERFNRGLPEFDDSPALLYFGDDVTCDDKLNGKVQIAPGRVRSQCLGQAGDAPVESRLKDPEKKKAQAVLPASCWSGWMHRYVQAVYGGSAVSYRLNGDGLELGTGDSAVTVSPWAVNSWGLVRSDAGVRFVHIDGEHTAHFYRPRFSICGRQAFDLWRALQEEDAPEALTDKILTVALSACIPGEEESAVALAISGEIVGTYGWAFSGDGKKAVVVTASDTEMFLYEVAFAEDGPVLELLDATPLPPVTWAPRIISPSGGASITVIKGADATLAPDDSYDVPLQAWYEDNDLVTVYYSLVAEAADPVPDASRCQHNIFSDWASGSCVDPHEFRLKPAGLTTCAVAHGIRKVAGGSTLWSSVGMTNGVVVSGAIQRSQKVVFEALSCVPALEANVVRSVESGDGTAWPGTTGMQYFLADMIPPAGYYTEGYFDGCVPNPQPGDNCFSTDPSGRVGMLPTNPESGAFEYASESVTWFGKKWAFFRSKADMNVLPSEYTETYSLGSDQHLVLPFGDRKGAYAISYEFAGADGSFLSTQAAATRATDASFEAIHESHTYTYNGPINHHRFSWTRDFSAATFLKLNLTISDQSEADWDTSTPISTDNACEITYGGEEYKVYGAGAPFEEAGVVLTQPDGAVPWTGLSNWDPSCRTGFPGLLSVPEEDAHIEVETASGPIPLAVAKIGGDYVCQGFIYRALRSILGALVTPKVDLEFGDSISMDRESISGGYPKVHWPSFVGWA